jgi:hypothetical protein
MDDLIKSVKKFSIDNDSQKFDDSLDLVISKMSTLTPDNTHGTDEWDNLKSNYSKLRYLNYLLTKKSLDLPRKFFQSLDTFLNSMDLTTQYYFATINFEMESYSPDLLVQTRKVKELLEKSLNCNESLKKMEYILSAYSILVPIAEDINNEKFRDFIDDDHFLENFSVKRQRIK